jgi:hypothetical protein
MFVDTAIACSTVVLATTHASQQNMHNTFILFKSSKLSLLAWSIELYAMYWSRHCFLLANHCQVLLSFFIVINVCFYLNAGIEMSDRFLLSTRSPSKSNSNSPLPASSSSPRAVHSAPPSSRSATSSQRQAVTKSDKHDEATVSGDDSDVDADGDQVTTPHALLCSLLVFIHVCLCEWIRTKYCQI